MFFSQLRTKHKVTRSFINSCYWILSAVFQIAKYTHWILFVVVHLFYSCLCVWMCVVTCLVGYSMHLFPPSGHRHLQMFSLLQRLIIPYSIQHRGWRYDPWEQSSSQVRLQIQLDTRLNLFVTLDCCPTVKIGCCGIAQCCCIRLDYVIEEFDTTTASFLGPTESISLICMT